MPDLPHRHAPYRSLRFVRINLDGCAGWPILHLFHLVDHEGSAVLAVADPRDVWTPCPRAGTPWHRVRHLAQTVEKAAAVTAAAPAQLARVP